MLMHTILMGHLQCIHLLASGVMNFSVPDCQPYDTNKNKTGHPWKKMQMQINYLSRK